MFSVLILMPMLIMKTILAALEAEKSTKALEFVEKSYEAGRATIYDLNNAEIITSMQGSVSQAKYNFIFSTKLLNFYAGIPLSL